MVENRIIGFYCFIRDAVQSPIFLDNSTIDYAKLQLLVALIKLANSFENLLYNTGLVMGEKISPEKMSRINDLVLALQKDSLNLGSVITSDND